MASPAGSDCGKAAQAPCCRAGGGALQPAPGQAGAPAWSSTPPAAASGAGGGSGCAGGWRVAGGCGPESAASCSAAGGAATNGPVLGSGKRMGRGSFLAGGGESSSASGAGAGAAVPAALTKPACMAVAKPVVCSVPLKRNSKEVSAARARATGVGTYYCGRERQDGHRQQGLQVHVQGSHPPLTGPFRCCESR